MSRKLNIVLVAFFLALSTVFSQRILYVDNFNNILGNHEKEQELLSFAHENNFTSIILYELNKVDQRFHLGDKTENNILANFISEAKINYGVKEVIASAENGGFFINELAPYNNSRNNSNEKFDGFNLEYEYWKKSASDYGGYYCENYLRKNGLPCSREGSFKYFVETLSIMKLLSQESEHPIKIEAYVGRYTKKELSKMSNYLDRVLISAYATNPRDAFVIVKKKLEEVALISSKIEVSIIFSSELNYMGGNLKYNSLKDNEEKFLEYCNFDSKNLSEFTYYNYTYLTKSLDYFKFRSTGIASR